MHDKLSKRAMCGDTGPPRAQYISRWGRLSTTTLVLSSTGALIDDRHAAELYWRLDQMLMQVYNTTLGGAVQVFGI